MCRGTFIDRTILQIDVRNLRRLQIQQTAKWANRYIYIPRELVLMQIHSQCSTMPEIVNRVEIAQIHRTEFWAAASNIHGPLLPAQYNSPKNVASSLLLIELIFNHRI